MMNVGRWLARLGINSMASMVRLYRCKSLVTVSLGLAA
jgi:hypothetical protein